MSRGAKIAVILSACAIALIILVVVVIAVFAVKTVTAPADTANHYIKALNTGDVSTAWSYLTTRTQNQETRQGFESKVASLKGSISNWDTSVVSVQDGEAKVIINVTGTDGSHHGWDILLIKQGGEWKVDRISRG
jgi:uncharacterized membrane protein YvbJ